MSSLTSVADSEEDSHQVVAILWKDLSAMSKLFPRSKQTHKKTLKNQNPSVPKSLNFGFKRNHPQGSLPSLLLLTLEIKEHAGEGWYSHKKVKNNSTVGVVGAVVVGLRRKVAQSLS